MRKRIISLIFASFLTMGSLFSCSDMEPITGPQGEQGETGPKGDKGEDGIDGIDGEDGLDGEDGKDGATWLTGEGTPSDNLGNINDLYLNTSNYNIYLKTNDGWTLIGNIKGEAGLDGIDGTDGIDGSRWYFGSTDPDDSEATNIGDLYLNLTSGAIFTVDSSYNWRYIGNLKGDKGDTGETGDKGETGNSFLTGVGKPSNSLGNDGDLYIDTETTDLYKKENGEWKKILTLNPGDDSADKNNFHVASPDGTVEAEIKLRDGKLTYRTLKDGEQIVDFSTLGISTNVGDFTQGLVYSYSSTDTINSDFTLKGNKVSEVHEQSNQLTLGFTKDSQLFEVIFRVSNDGVAFRYHIISNRGNVTVYSEASSFSLPSSTEIYAIPRNYNDSNSPWSYEALYTIEDISQIDSPISMPALYKIDEDTYGLLTEADLFSNRTVGSWFVPNGGSGLRITRAPRTTTESYDTNSSEYTTPWRVNIYGGLGTIVESTFVEELNPASVLSDESWIEPGATAWSWLDGYHSAQHDLNKTKQYIDLAADFGWKYFLLDEGWQPRVDSNGRYYDGFYDDFDEIIDYANERGIGILVWKHNNDLNTDEEREVFKTYKEKGIKGVKVDFFESEDPDMLDNMGSIYQAAIDNQLILNIHGGNKPTGESRTYPNVLNREAIYGEEQGSTPYADQLTIIPFARAAVGQSDYTPRVTSKNGNTTQANQIALNFVYQSGIPTMADTVSNYRSYDACNVLKGLPGEYDEIKFIAGAPDDSFVVARRKGETWYLSGITNKAQEMDISLDFLAEDTNYVAFAVEDGTNRSIADTKNITLDNSSTYHASMDDGGGFVLKIEAVPEGASPFTSISVTNKPSELAFGSQYKLDVSATGGDGNDLLIYESTDENVANVSSDGTLHTYNNGSATITAHSAYDPDVRDSFTVIVVGEVYEGWNTGASDTIGTFDGVNTNQLTLKTVDGGPDNENLRNYWYREVANGDYTLTVKVTGDFPTSGYPTAGLTINIGNNPFFSILRRYHNSFGSCFEMFFWNGGFNEDTIKETDLSKDAYLRIVKQGNQFTAYYRYEDDADFTQVGSTRTIDDIANASTVRIGVYGGNSGGTNTDHEVTFTDFTVNGEIIQFFSL